ncbi:glyoxal oxidase precursor [Mycena amicta]|nr:glyoxal oxidase precursor [Mycena amicta]
MLLSFGLSFLLNFLGTTAQRTIQWSFVQNGTSGVIPVELITLSPTLMMMYDRADGNPLLLPNGERAWAALWNLETQTPTPLETVTDTFCAGGAFISNGTLVSVAGQPLEPGAPPPQDGRMGIRLFGPCLSPTGANCTVFEDPGHIHLQVIRWYPTGLRIPDGSLMIIGGSSTNTFYNSDLLAVNSIEFFPSKEDTVRPSKFLFDAEPVNMFPRSFVLPSGRVFVIANNITMLYDIQAKTETRLPSVPLGVRVANPFDGSAQLLPLSPPLYEPTVLVCGGSATDDARPTSNLTNLDPATNQCSRITLTPAGIARGWEVERMPETRILVESVLLPTGDVLFINGAKTGYSGYPSVSNANATLSNAANPATRPILYRTTFPAGLRITQDGLPSSPIPRMYHSSASLTAKGTIMVAGSNPNPAVIAPGVIPFATEFRVEYLTPDFIAKNAPRPAIQSAPTKILFNQRATLKVTVPLSLLLLGPIQVSLMDMGYVTHAQHSNSRLVFLDHTLIGTTLTITAPPNSNIFPPGPAWIFLVANGVYSEGVQVMIGDGGDPPRPAAAQGIKIPINSI